MVKEKQPNFVLLVETLSTKKSLERISIRMGFDDLFVVEPIGRSGDLLSCGRRKEIWKYTIILDKCHCEG
jgi:hypothetical protein